MGSWGPLKNVQCIHGAQDLVSEGTLLDDIDQSVAAGVYSTPNDAYLLSGFDVNSMPPGVQATKIATRSGPGHLYETDMRKLTSGHRGEALNKA